MLQITRYIYFSLFSEYSPYVVLNLNKSKKVDIFKFQASKEYI